MREKKKLLLVYFRYFEGKNSNTGAPIECHYRALDVSVMRLSAELENFTHASCLTQSGLRGVSLREIKSTSHSESLFFPPSSVLLVPPFVILQCMFSYSTLQK